MTQSPAKNETAPAANPTATGRAPPRSKRLAGELEGQRADQNAGTEAHDQSDHALRDRELEPGYRADQQGEAADESPECCLEHRRYRCARARIATPYPRPPQSEPASGNENGSATSGQARIGELVAGPGS